MTHAGEVADLPGARQAAETGMPAQPPHRLSAFESDGSGRGVGQTKANGQYGAGKEQHVSHPRHAMLQLSFVDRPPPSTTH
jgi:hypothetical protein